MRHNETQGIAVISRKRLAIVVSSQQHFFLIQIGERDVGGISLLRVN
jgi:hypothetical protein